MAAADEIGAARKSAIELRRVKANIFATDAGQNIGAQFLGKARRVNCVESRKNGTVRHEKTLSGIVTIHGIPPGYFAANAQMLFQENIGPNAGVKTAADGLRRVAAVGAASRRRYQRTKSQAQVRLLRMNCGRHGKNKT